MYGRETATLRGIQQQGKGDGIYRFFDAQMRSCNKSAWTAERRKFLGFSISKGERGLIALKSLLRSKQKIQTNE